MSESGMGFNASAVNRTFSYDDLNRLTSLTGDPSGAITFDYDANGNLRKQTQASSIVDYEYDVRDQLRRVMNGSSEVASFDYDFERRRPKKSTGGQIRRPNRADLEYRNHA